MIETGLGGGVVVWATYFQVHDYVT